MARFNELETKKDRTAHIRSMLACNKAWAIRGLLRIYANQTDEEQRIEETRLDNGVGFTGADAQILSSFAKQIEHGRSMSSKQMELIFKRMPKYARQLEEVSAS